MRKRRDSFSSTNNSLPDVLSMLVNRHKVLLVRISWYLAGFLTFRLNIVTRVWPHRDQFQVYGLDLFLLSRFCRKRETVYYRDISVRRMQPVCIFRSYSEIAEKLHSVKY